MPTPRMIHHLFIMTASVCLCNTAYTQTPPEATAAPTVRAIRLEAGPSSNLTIDGTSTLHPYKLQAGQVTTVLQVSVPLSDTNDNNALVQAMMASSPMTVDVRVPVAALTSGEKELDKNARKALQSDKYEEIAFHMESYTAVPMEARKNAFTVTSKGLLTIAGVQRPITLVTDVTIDKNQMLITGAATISMTDFGVVPPKLFFGAITVGPDIVVHFALAMKAPGEQSASK